MDQLPRFTPSYPKAGGQEPASARRVDHPEARGGIRGVDLGNNRSGEPGANFKNPTFFPPMGRALMANASL
ncbi:hypothetical protein thsps21_34530 [Pseudomonas sp. No.21]|nr:hypothetical protein TUM20249_42930 [Pseudomonas tohonis]